ncbi:hypothetical protein [Actinopolyspora halophila]|uniref:hypothetical protein n=1 Tax=Actinopolyspora halophila TaxID=1850 RepID=UPI0003705626|nr:hypothetical protein [Actinopolyspora halophila]
MRFAAEHLVTVSGFDVDADDPIDCLETVLKPAEWLEATALTVEPNTGEGVKHDYRASTTVATPHERGATIAEVLHAEGMPVLEMFEVAAKRYRVEETDEGRTEAELIGPDEPFDPLLGLKLLSLRGRNDVVAAADYAPAEFPLDREAVHARARRHTRFELPGVRPEEVVVRVQLWLAAADLTTAVELARKPLLESGASLFEFLPAGEDPADGYHAALLFVVPGTEQLTPEERPTTRHVAPRSCSGCPPRRHGWSGSARSRSARFDGRPRQGLPPHGEGWWRVCTPGSARTRSEWSRTPSFPRNPMRNSSWTSRSSTTKRTG